MTTMPDIFNRIARRLTVSPLVALLIAVALMVGALTLAIQNDRLGKAEKLRQASVQAEILASSLAAPLAFDDDEATREYLKAFKADAAIQAAAAYDANGALVAGFAQPGTVLPAQGKLTAPTFQGRDLIVTAMVAQGDSRIGTVYLRSSIETGLRRAMRYLGIALIVIFASLLVALLGASYASLSHSHARLEAEIESREKAEAGAAPVAENGGDGPADRRRRARFQQSADGRVERPRAAGADQRSRQARAAEDRHPPGGRPRRQADAAIAHLRPTLAAQSRGDRPGRTHRRSRYPARSFAARGYRIDIRFPPCAVAGRGGCVAARSRCAQHDGQRARRHARWRDDHDQRA